MGILIKHQQEITHNWLVHVVVGKRKDKTSACKKSIHMERGTHVPSGKIRQREEVEMVWTCAKAGQRWGHEKDITSDSRRKQNRGRPKLKWRD